MLKPWYPVEFNDWLLKYELHELQDFISRAELGKPIIDNRSSSALKNQVCKLCKDALRLFELAFLQQFRCYFQNDFVHQGCLLSACLWYIEGLKNYCYSAGLYILRIKAFRFIIIKFELVEYWRNYYYYLRRDFRKIDNYEDKWQFIFLQTASNRNNNLHI